MIESIKITAINKAYDLPYKHTIPQDIWITVIDPEEEDKIKRHLSPGLRSKGIKHFVQYFYDWSDEDTEPYIVSRLEKDGPQIAHINNIISFLYDHVHDSTHHHLGVNCMAGVSRSTAVGVIALVMQGKAPMEALDEILKVRPIAWPNLRMLRFAGDRLGVDIFTPISEWKKENTTKLYEL